MNEHSCSEVRISLHAHFCFCWYLCYLYKEHQLGFFTKRRKLYVEIDCDSMLSLSVSLFKLMPYPWDCLQFRHHVLRRLLHALCPTGSWTWELNTPTKDFTDFKKPYSHTRNQALLITYMQLDLHSTENIHPQIN